LEREKITPLELLAPAGDADIGIAAIDHGADAVYIGAPKFSARAAAGVRLDDISRLIEYAHFYRVKVYVALNTILNDSELAESLALIRTIHALGADGLIIQDVGLLELDLPPIPLIASTQMHNSTPEKVRFLEAVGFQRAILARELSLSEIAGIRRQARKIELETFVHGALCVSYSGQCYMSQAIAGRSGNRGVCAQPCRSHYTLLDGRGKTRLKNKYLLSLKDLNLISRVPDLIAAGSTCFKIEGRYKGMDYVKNVTAAYRQVIDQFIHEHAGYRRGSSGISELVFIPDVSRTFNRGYSQYFVDGRREKIASMDTQKSIGQCLGKITAVGKDYFQIECEDLQNGDGLCFFTGQCNLTGVRVNRVHEGKIYPNSMKGLEAGLLLYRNFDAAFAKGLKRTSARRLITVELGFRQSDTFIRLVAKDEDGNQAEAVKEVWFDPSQNPDKAREHIEKQLTRTGNTPFRISRLTIEPREPGHLSASLLNSLRRDVLEKLTRLRHETYFREDKQFQFNDVPYPEKYLDFRANVFNAAARRFYERHGATVTEPAFETFSDLAGKTLMTTRYCIRYQLDLCPRFQQSEAFVEEPLYLRDAHHTYRLEFDCKQCRMSVILEN